MKVKELMRTSVARVAPAVTVREALSRMDGSGVTSLPIEDAEGCLLGVARLADLSRAMAEGSVASSAAVGDGLSSHLVTATPEMVMGFPGMPGRVGDDELDAEEELDA